MPIPLAVSACRSATFRGGWNGTKQIDRPTANERRAQGTLPIRSTNRIPSRLPEGKPANVCAPDLPS